MFFCYIPYVLDEVVLVDPCTFHVSIVFNLELKKICRNKYIVTLSLYKFIHAVIRNTSSLNIDRIVFRFC